MDYRLKDFLPITPRQARRLADLRTPQATATQEELDDLATALLNQGRGRGRKPASLNFLTDRQLADRRRQEVPFGENLSKIRAHYRPQTGALHQAAR